MCVDSTILPNITHPLKKAIKNIMTTTKMNKEIMCSFWFFFYDLKPNGKTQKYSPNARILPFRSVPYLVSWRLRCFFFKFYSISKSNPPIRLRPFSQQRSNEMKNMFRSRNIWSVVFNVFPSQLSQNWSAFKNGEKISSVCR